MKNISKITILLFIILVTFSCVNKEDNSNIKLNNLENLKNDNRFIELLNNKKTAITNIKDIEKAILLNEKENLTENDVNELVKALGFKNIEEYSKYINKEIKLELELENDYNISEIPLIDLENLTISVLETGNLKKGDPCNCERMRINCIGIATSASIVGNIGCASLDIAIIPGIICHAAVLTAQYLASDSCNASAENCVSGC